ncbi:MAG TPA: hypothetical protein VFV52_16170 [Bacilli bacterium]|nr:hypothetical protein [Bacilli bacterium]
MAQAQDQAAFWQNLLTGITKNVGSANPAQNVMACGSTLVAQFDQSLETAQAQIYDLGNTIPVWSLTWNTAYNNKMFGTYENWVEQITPQPSKDATEDMYTKMQTINQKIAGMSDGINSIMKNQYMAYLQDYCMEFEAGSTTSCKTYMPGAPQFADVWNDYKKSSQYQQQTLELQQQFGSTLDGLQEQYNELALQYYGPGYQRIAEAQQAVQLADPADLNSGITADNQKTYQMQVDRNSNVTWVSRFDAGDLSLYKQWLGNQKATGPKFGQDANIQVVFSNQTTTKDSSEWKFTANGGLPIADFFWLGGSASGSRTQVDVSKYSFKGIISYQDVYELTIQPADSWFFEDLLSTYADYNNFPDGSPFKGKDMWGPDGLLNVVVKGVIIGYAPYMNIEVDNWNESDLKTTWSEKATFGIGPFTFESESSSGSSEHYSLVQTTSGIEVKDTSGQAHIIALIVDTPNYK